MVLLAIFLGALCIWRAIETYHNEHFFLTGLYVMSAVGSAAVMIAYGI